MGDKTDDRLDGMEEVEVSSVCTRGLKAFKEADNTIRLRFWIENFCELCGEWVLVGEKPKAGRSSSKSLDVRNNAGPVGMKRRKRLK